MCVCVCVCISIQVCVYIYEKYLYIDWHALRMSSYIISLLNFFIITL